MISCRDVRWNIAAFLNGLLGAEGEEEIRKHLDRCNDCVNALVSEPRIDCILPHNAAPLGDDFAARVVTSLPEESVSATLFRYLCGVFAASASVGVAIYAFLRQYLHSSTISSLQPSRWDAQGSWGSLLPWFSSALSSPTFRYALLAIGATLLSILLIAAVDRPWRRAVSQLSGK